MSGSMPFRPQEDPGPDAREEGDNDDEEEEVDETVGSYDTRISGISQIHRATRRSRTLFFLPLKSASRC